ncbi:NTP transferase domain-containing protein [Candidatus Woesearchaeota archaeon]|nr:NTP transferase domain-containing protein [Candidatus Woesearchaeota archaeon]
MKAVILAAGKGKRLRPITQDIPKAMVEVGGKPLLERIILQLKGKGFKEFVVVVGYKKEIVEHHFKDGSSFGVHIQFVAQKELLGTGHALLEAEQYLKDEKEFLLVFADTFFDESAIDNIIKAPTPGVIGVTQVDDPRAYGVVELDDRCLVKNVVEKPEVPSSNLVVTGLYKLPHKIFDALKKIPLSPRGEYELPHAVMLLIKEGVEFCIVKMSLGKDIASAANLEEARSIAKGRH